MNYKTSLAYLVMAIVMSACTSQKVIDQGQQKDTHGATNPADNLVPMYGYPSMEKTEAQRQADTEFINASVASLGTREKASKAYAAEAWHDRQKGDAENAMRRFNQSWLLNPNNYQPYWGFGSLLLAQRRPAEAAVYMDKALSLIGDAQDKPKLLTDAGRVYTALGSMNTGKLETEGAFEKANSLLGQAVELDPQYASAYQVWAFSYYAQGNYAKAWEMVGKSRSLGLKVSPQFIASLTQKMPEP